MELVDDSRTYTPSDSIPGAWIGTSPGEEPVIARRLVQGSQAANEHHILDSFLPDTTTYLPRYYGQAEDRYGNHLYSRRQFIQGQSLADMLVKGALPDRVQLHLISIQLAGFLALLHSMEIVHRDIKPANIIIDETGMIWVIDFGVAAHIEDRELPVLPAGTDGFAPPEAETGKVDYSHDVFSFGVTLAVLATGRPVSEMVQNLPIELGEGSDPGLADLVRDMTSLVPGHRPDMDVVFNRVVRSVFVDGDQAETGLQPVEDSGYSSYTWKPDFRYYFYRVTRIPGKVLEFLILAVLQFFAIWIYPLALLYFIVKWIIS